VTWARDRQGHLDDPRQLAAGARADLVGLPGAVGFDLGLLAGVRNPSRMSNALRFRIRSSPLDPEARMPSRWTPTANCSSRGFRKDRIHAVRKVSRRMSFAR